ncbi:MAG: DNA cytosine methyltransferase [Dehalococcoidia bacterium]
MPVAIAEVAGAAYGDQPRTFRSIELFSGAGGLALGTHLAGFHHEVLVEWDADAMATLESNARHDAVDGLREWRVERADVRAFDYRPYEGVDLVAGGPPCQPFSIGGKHRGADDSRNMIPEFVRAIRELAPPVFVMENVRGLLRPGFRPYFEYVVESLRQPLVVRREDESWTEHRDRLADRHSLPGLRYDVRFEVLNAADYGVPQSRHRVFVVGFRSDLAVPFRFPDATHSLDALLHDQWVSGTYWERHGVPRPEAPPESVARRVGRLARARPFGEAWRTVRDAIGDLPEPQATRDGPVANHRLQPGARAYVGHTGSDHDLPAKTLKAGDHGVPGGENMLRQRNGRVRYFTVREAARIQTFPDSWVFRGAWSEAMRQIGNAVPVQLAQAIGRSVRIQLRNA